MLQMFTEQADAIPLTLAAGKVGKVGFGIEECEVLKKILLIWEGCLKFCLEIGSGQEACGVVHVWSMGVLGQTRIICENLGGM
jgi:hypothetical protein